MELPKGHIEKYTEGQTFAFSPTARNTGAVTVHNEKKTMALIHPNGEDVKAGDFVAGQSYFVAIGDEKP